VLFGATVAILILLVSVAWHELGHYIAAKAVGATPPIYSIGFGPTLRSTQRWGTTWKLSAFPLGGYVKPPPDMEKALSLPRQAIVYAAGPFANYLLAVVTILGITIFAPDSTKVTPAQSVTRPAIALVQVFQAVPEAIGNGGKDFDGPVGIVRVGGGIVDDGDELRTAERPVPPPRLVRIFMLLAVLNIGLMAANLFPIPVLDGGHIALIGFSGLVSLFLRRQWRVPEVAKTVMLALGVIALGAFLGFVTIHDIIQ
jgi:regulator of sigma E protease